MRVVCDADGCSWPRPTPQVNYREGISRNADVRYTHKKQSGGSGQFADVAIRFEPGEAGTGFTFKSDIKGGSVPKEFVPGTYTNESGDAGIGRIGTRVAAGCSPAFARSMVMMMMMMMMTYARAAAGLPRGAWSRC